MAANSSIEWTDATWNPVLGCSGCKNCYAIIVARSWRARRKKMTNSLVKSITLEGFAAIEYAEEHGLSLSKYNDPTEDSREGLTPDEARAVAPVWCLPARTPRTDRHIDQARSGESDQSLRLVACRCFYGLRASACLRSGTLGNGPGSTWR